MLPVSPLLPARLLRLPLERLGLRRPLRRLKRRIQSHFRAARLEREVLAGYRLIPEEDLARCYRNVLRMLIELSDGEPLGDYLEFGVCHGASLACMHQAAAALDLRDIRLFGFDSFAGLPADAEEEEDKRIWKEGQYRVRPAFARRFLTEAGVDWSRVRLIEGWFRETLTPGLVTQLRLTRASVIMVDCDIYSSAREALEFCAPLIRDRAVILFDDWHSAGPMEKSWGERRAFEEFLTRHPVFKVEPLPSYAQNAEVFLITRQRTGRANAELRGEERH